MAATWRKAGPLRSVNTGSAQTSAQRPQRVHARAAKLRTGSPSRPGERIACGQAAMQSPQAVQAPARRPPSVQGGRSGAGSAARGPERKLRRESLGAAAIVRSEEHTSELQSLMRISYAVFCLKKKTNPNFNNTECHALHYL